MDQFTFIISAYNSQRTISCTINSILCQTCSNYKIILVNDGSTDNTPQICERKEKDDGTKSKVNDGYQDRIWTW